jgi:hypothetical protein
MFINALEEQDPHDKHQTPVASEDKYHRMHHDWYYFTEHLMLVLFAK